MAEEHNLDLNAGTTPGGIDERDANDGAEEGDDVLYKYDISSYGADYPVDSLVKRINSGAIFVPRIGKNATGDSEVAGFQRGYVWNRRKSDRFIESLLLGLPVPGIFLVREKKNRLLVLDGQQRLETLRAFCDESGDYQLKYVEDRFKGLTYRSLPGWDRIRLDDRVIHATIVQQDEPSDDMSSIYLIFERLNTGGVNLTSQEIRMALYHGHFAQLLLELNESKAWRTLYGKEDKRLRDLELILRFFAFYYDAASYSTPMKAFFNKHMNCNRQLQLRGADELRGVFSRTVSVLLSAVGTKALRPKGPVNAAVGESVMVGVTRRLEGGKINNEGRINERYTELVENEEYWEAVRGGTSSRANVEKRLRLATSAFADVK